MKVRVIEKFRDKNTRKIHNVGDILTITQTRYDEIQSVGNLVEEIKEEPKAEPKKTTKKATAKKSN